MQAERFLHVKMHLVIHLTLSNGFVAHLPRVQIITNILLQSGGDSGLDITAYYSKKGCKKNDPDPKAHTVIRNLAYNVGTQIPTHSKNYQSLRISRDLGNNEYLVIDTDGADEGTWWCWEEHKAGCCENAEGFTFNHVTLVLEKEGRPRAV